MAVKASFIAELGEAVDRIGCQHDCLVKCNFLSISSPPGQHFRCRGNRLLLSESRGRAHPLLAMSSATQELKASIQTKLEQSGEYDR